MESLDPGTRAAILERLTSATRAGSIHWSASEGRPYWYYADLNSFSYSVESSDVDDAPPYDVHVFRRGLSEVPTEVDTWWWDREGNSPLNDFIRSLYIAAQAAAMGTLNLVNDLFSDLAQTDGGPAEPSTIDLFGSDGARF